MKGLQKWLVFFGFMILLSAGVFILFFIKSEKIGNKYSPATITPSEKITTSPPPIQGTYGIIKTQVGKEEVSQIAGWVLEKAENPRILVLAQSLRKQRVVLAAGVKFIKPKDFANRSDVTFVNSSWEEIYPDRTKIIGLCVDPECKEVNQVMITEIR